MKKHILAILSFSLLISFSGCSNNNTNNDKSQIQDVNKTDISTSTDKNEFENTTNLSHKYTEDLKNESTVAILIKNNLIDTTNLTKIEDIIIDTDGESFTVIPKEEGSVIEVWDFKNDEGEFIKNELKYKNTYTEKNTAYNFILKKSKENSLYKIIISNQKAYSEYIIEKDETSNTDYITLSKNKTDNTSQFSITELNYIFAQNQNSIIKLLGTPNQEEEYKLFEDEMAAKLNFKNATIHVRDEERSVFKAEFTDNLITHSRDIKVGDTIDMVLAKFPNNNNTEIINDGFIDYTLLYGNYSHFQAFGIKKYDDTGNIVQVMYSDKGAGIIIDIKNNLVTKISYVMPLT